MNASFRVDPGLAVGMSQVIRTEKDLFTLFSIALDQTTAIDLRRLVVNRLDDLSTKDVLDHIRTEAQPEVLDGISRSNLFPTTYKSFARAAALGRKEKIMSMKIEDYKPAYPELLPALTDEEFESLKKDIELRGVIVPVEIDIATNEIVDGYHRHKAAVELGIADTIPITKRQFKSEVERRLHALSLNVHRRQLSPSQRAAYAADMLPLFERHARERQLAALKKGTVQPVGEKVSPRGKARDEAAEAFHTNPKYVSDAKRIKEESPEKFQEIKDGSKTISEVKKELRGGETLGRTNPDGPYPRDLEKELAVQATQVKWTLKAALRRIEIAIKAETRQASHADYVGLGEWLAERGELMKSTRTFGDGTVVITKACPTEN